jgi:hypothetical protein
VLILLNLVLRLVKQSFGRFIFVQLLILQLS